MGRFLLGSTVVMLFPAGATSGRSLAFNPAWAPGRPIRLGEAMATRA
jgi:phosphatidylserine decarboxylase